MAVGGAQESRLCAVLGLKCGVEWSPGSTLVMMPKASVAGSRTDVQAEVDREGGEEPLSGIVGGEAGEREAVLGAESRDEELLVSTKGALVLDTSSCPVLPRVVTCECVKP